MEPEGSEIYLVEFEPGSLSTTGRTYAASEIYLVEFERSIYRYRGLGALGSEIYLVEFEHAVLPHDSGAGDRVRNLPCGI